MSSTRTFVAVLALLGSACGGGGDDAVDAPAPDTVPVTVDAPVADGASVDAGAPDATPAPVVLYGLIAGKLVWLDPATGALTEIADGPADARFVWDPSVSLMYAVISPLENPSLGIIDLCTGEIGPGPALTNAGTQVPKAEGFARDPASGTWFACIDADGSAPTVYLSETLATLALDSGAVTPVGTVDTYTDDCDSLVYVDGALEALDVDQPNNRAALYTVDTATAGTTIATAFDDDVVRVAWDASRGLLFGHTKVARQLVTIDRATGELAIVGETHDATVYADAPFTALAAAPLRTCPTP